MTFYFGQEDTRKKEKITLRLEESLLNNLKSEQKEISAAVREILKNHYKKERVRYEKIMEHEGK